MPKSTAIAAPLSRELVPGLISFGTLTQALVSIKAISEDTATCKQLASDMAISIKHFRQQNEQFHKALAATLADSNILLKEFAQVLHNIDKKVDLLQLENELRLEHELDIKFLHVQEAIEDVMMGMI